MFVYKENPSKFYSIQTMAGNFVS